MGTCVQLNLVSLHCLSDIRFVTMGMTSVRLNVPRASAIVSARGRQKARPVAKQHRQKEHAPRSTLTADLQSQLVAQAQTVRPLEEVLQLRLSFCSLQWPIRRAEYSQNMIQKHPTTATTLHSRTPCRLHASLPHLLG